jgi:Ni/Co efflux regulator RcnB
MLAAKFLKGREGKTMKILTATRVAALAVGLSLAGSQAFAAPHDGRGNRNNDNTASGEQNSRDQNDGQRKKQKGAKENPTRAPAAAPAEQVQPRNVERRGANERKRRNSERADDTRARTKPAVRDNPTVRNDDRPNWSNKDRRPRVDVRRYNRNFTATRRYRVESYRQPYGYSYRRWNYGQRLPRHYYVRNFWLTNFLFYGLFTPPPGYIWVRYGPDALLIDEYTGEIVQVQYDIFYS